MALSKEQLERLIARSTDIVIATDAEGKVVYYNDGASRTLGYSSEEVLGLYVGRLYPSIEEARTVMKAMRADDCGGAGIIETFRTTLLSKSGEEIPVAISGTILFDEQGNENGTVGFAKDLREILHNDKLATLGEVAIGLSHEINNPLAVMVNQITLLEREIDILAGDRDNAVESERINCLLREIGRISEILKRLGSMVESEQYATVEYSGPARMIDLSARGAERSQDRRLEGLRILVVDDDSGICASLKEILEADGCTVETACDGAEGLRHVEAGEFDLVVTDVVMPNMDGYELYRAIREIRPEVPVLMMTAFHYDKDHIIKRSRIEGLQGVIFKKPVDPDRLREVIRESVKR